MVESVNAAELHEAVASVCPDITGVYMRNPADKASWGIWFLPSASPTAQENAQAALESFTL